MPPCLWETCFIIDNYCIVPNLSSSSTTIKSKSWTLGAYNHKYLLFRGLGITFMYSPKQDF